MQVKSYRLHNIGRFKELDIALAPTAEFQSNITVFIGNNGAGKTSLLQSLAVGLSWFVARLKKEKSNGLAIPETLLFNHANYASIDVTVEDVDLQVELQSYEWKIVKTRTGRKVELHSQLKALSQWVEQYHLRFDENEYSALPLIAFYPVERGVLDIPLKIREKHQFLQLDGYDNALSNAVDFRRFFEWFRDREDVENENLKNIIQSLREASIDHVIRAEIYEDEQLKVVRQAIYHFMPSFSNLRVERKPRLHMSIDKAGQTLNVSQLSQGEKSLMALVGDIARRLAMMNPNAVNPLHGEGIVLIDEVDMHLHPQWQRTIIQRLQNTFPNCQFVLTTHSPLVISDVPNILVYSLEEDDQQQIQLNTLPSLYGQDANQVLLQYMDTEYRNEDINSQIGEILNHIQNNQLDIAKQNIEQLRQEIGVDNLEVMKLSALLKKKTLLQQRS